VDSNAEYLDKSAAVLLLMVKSEEGDPLTNKRYIPDVIQVRDLQERRFY